MLVKGVGDHQQRWDQQRCGQGYPQTGFQSSGYGPKDRTGHGIENQVSQEHIVIIGRCLAKCQGDWLIYVRQPRLFGACGRSGQKRLLF